MNSAVRVYRTEIASKHQINHVVWETSSAIAFRKVRNVWNIVASVHFSSAFVFFFLNKDIFFFSFNRIGSLHSIRRSFLQFSSRNRIFVSQFSPHNFFPLWIGWALCLCFVWNWMLSWHAQTHHFLDHCLRVPFLFCRCYFSLNSVNAFSKFVQWLSLSLSVSLDGYLLNKIYSLHVIYVALHKQRYF